MALEMVFVCSRTIGSLEVIPWESCWTVTVTGCWNVVSKERPSGRIWQMYLILTPTSLYKKSEVGDSYLLKMSTDSPRNTRHEPTTGNFRIITFAASAGR